MFFFCDLGLILGGLRSSNCKKSLKIAKNRCRDAFGARLGFSYEFGNDFGGIVQHFESILVGFWKDLEGFLRFLGRTWDAESISGCRTYFDD